MQNEKLKETIDRLKKARFTNVLSVFATKNPDDETSSQIYNIQEKFLTLSEDVKDKMVSEKTSKEIELIGDIFKLSLLQLATISRAIRSYYFSELKLNDFPAYLSKEIPVEPNVANEISKMIIQKIINDDSEEQEYQARLEKLSLLQALNKYPEINDQLITSNRINIKQFSEPARPSVKNWLSDYTFTMGFDSHDSAARGTYLFRNDNAKNLNATDKTKLNYILKVFDTGESIEINLTLKQIIFPKSPLPEAEHDIHLQKISAPIAIENEMETEAKNLPLPSALNISQKTTNYQSSSPANLPTLPKKIPLAAKPKIEFTSPQKLPFEKHQPQPTQLRRDVQPIEEEEIDTTPKPIMITPINFQKNTTSKNIIDLKK